MVKCPVCGGIKDASERIKLYQDIIKGTDEKDQEIANLKERLEKSNKEIDRLKAKMYWKGISLDD